MLLKLAGETLITADNISGNQRFDQRKSAFRSEVDMAMVDPLADTYTRIRNANRVGKETVDIPASKMKRRIAEILKEEGFIENVKLLEDNRQGIIRIKLKYGKRKSKLITNIKQISKPGLRIYIKADEIPQVLGGMGIAIISTSRGILTNAGCRKERVGGEVLCYVW